MAIVYDEPSPAPKQSGRIVYDEEPPTPEESEGSLVDSLKSAASSAGKSAVALSPIGAIPSLIAKEVGSALFNRKEEITEEPTTVSVDERKPGITYTKIPGKTYTRSERGGGTTIEEPDSYVEATASPAIESWSARALQSIDRIRKASMVYPGVAAQFAKSVYENSMREKMTDTVAKGLGYKDTEEFLDREREHFKQKALRDASAIEQVLGGALAQVADPVAIATSGYGLSTAAGLARSIKLAASGAGYTGSLEALVQVTEDGTITDPGKVLTHAAIGGVAVPVLDKAIRMGARIRTEGILKRIERRTQENIDGHMNPQAAYDKALFDSGVSERDIASMIDGTGRTQHFPTAFNPLSRPEMLKQLRGMGYSPLDIQRLAKHDPIEGYIKATNQNGILKKLSNSASTITSYVGGHMDHIIQPISSALRKINPALLNGIRKNELNTNLDTNEWRTIAKPFIDITSKLDKQTYKALHKALINRDDVMAKRVLERVPGGKEAKEQVDILLDAIHNKYVQVGVDMNYLDKYFPRLLKKGEYKTLVKKLGGDPKSPFAQLLRTKEQDKAFKKDYARYIAEQEAKHGVQIDMVADLNIAGMKDEFKFGWEPRREPLSEREMNSLLNSYLKGITPEGLKTPSAARSRVLDTVPDDLLDHYGSIEDMLTSYIDHAAHTINIRKFFGKHIQNDKDIDADVGSSIGSFVRELWDKGEIKVTDMDQLGKLLQSRFGYKPTGEVSQDVKNLFYMTRLGQFKAALTQFGDLGISSYVNGWTNTILGLYRPARITREDIGVTKIAEEFGTTSATANALNHVFRYSGFKAVDNWGKKAFINAALIKNEELVKSAKGLEKFKKKWEPYFADETDNLINDLSKGRMTDNVKLLVFHELSDVQPVSLLEMPPAYLNSPNGRLFYAMKTFTIKQLDLLRRDAISKIRHGDAVEGTKNLAHYVMMVTAANMGADQIKAWVAGQEMEYEDAFIANIWRNFGVSQYLVGIAKDQYKPAAAITEALLSNPWSGMAQTADTIYQDLKSAGKKFDSLKYLPASKLTPGGGQWMYNLFGGGAEKYAEERRQKRLKGRLDEDE